MLVDAHVHLHEDPSMLEDGPVIVAVSDDLESSKRTLNLNAKFKCIGIHPWEVEKASERDLLEIEKLAEKADCLGEVGLDYRYVKDKEKMHKFFERFLILSREYDLPMNLHALDAWREVFELVMKYDVKRAYFHWYNGPINLIEEIVSQGYFIGVNAALKIQKKHERVAKAVPLKALLTESDGPYNYRGITLRPAMIKELVLKLSELRDERVETIEEAVLSNLYRWAGASLL